ncbi:hypothetical protein Ciccas_006459 [Cichlidogyrus casuarinus]|uniref:Sulfotransferase domain-containing protein n=1 Tax=Cichlidogyrus casuarinus TaxID=1844966 RepID=A0ABD2Q5R0_9PLAT
MTKQDVIVASFPKSGTTWLSEIVYLLTNNLDFKAAQSENLEWRVPYIEYVWPPKVELLSRPEPRILKTHLPLDLLPDDVRSGRSARIIYILRDPRDVVLSYYNFAKNFVPSGFKDKEGLAGFVHRFVQDRLPYSPWKENIRSYLMVAAEPGSHVLVVTYEELKEDLPKAIRKIDRFLNPSRLLSGKQIDMIAKHCSFEEMRNNPSTNFDWWVELGLWKNLDQIRFLNKGQVGSHKQGLTLEMRQQLEEKMKQESMEWTLIERRCTT